MKKFKNQDDLPDGLDDASLDPKNNRLSEARKKEIIEKIKKERENRSKNT